MWHRNLLSNGLVGLTCLLLVGTCYGKEFSGNVKWSGQIDLQESVIVGPDAISDDCSWNPDLACRFPGENQCARDYQQRWHGIGTGCFHGAVRLAGGRVDGGAKGQLFQMDRVLLCTGRNQQLCH